jgi:mRNA-degrading endonuclease toxin of MazEF toxin-antitoxin module
MGVVKQQRIYLDSCIVIYLIEDHPVYKPPGENMPRDYPTNVRVAPADGGLPMETVFLCFQIRSLDPPVGRVPRESTLGDRCSQTAGFRRCLCRQ